MNPENVHSFPPPTDDVNPWARRVPAAPTPAVHPDVSAMSAARDHRWPSSTHGQVDERDRALAMWAHLALTIGLVTTMGVGTIVATLVIWSRNRDRPFVRRAAADSFNAACTALIVFIGSMALGTLSLYLLNGMLLNPMVDSQSIEGMVGLMGGLAVAILVGQLVFMGAILTISIAGVIAATRAHAGASFRYRPVLRILS